MAATTPSFDGCVQWAKEAPLTVLTPEASQTCPIPCRTVYRSAQLRQDLVEVFISFNLCLMPTTYPTRSPFIVSIPAVTDTTVRVSSPLNPSPERLPASRSSSAMEATSMSAFTFPRLQNMSAPSTEGDVSAGVNIPLDVGPGSSVAATRQSESRCVVQPSDPTDRFLPSYFHTGLYVDAHGYGCGHSPHLSVPTGPCSGQLSPTHHTTYTCSGSIMRLSHDVLLTSPMTGYGQSTLAGQRPASQCMAQFPLLSPPRSQVRQAQGLSPAAHTNTNTNRPSPSMTHTQIPHLVPPTASSPIPIPVHRSPSQVRHIQAYNASLQTPGMLDRFHPHSCACCHSYHGTCSDTLPHSFPSASRKCCFWESTGTGCACYNGMFGGVGGQYGTKGGHQEQEMSGGQVDGLPVAHPPLFCRSRSLSCSYPPVGVARPFPSPDAVQRSSGRPVHSTCVHLRRSTLIREGLGNLDISQDRYAVMNGTRDDVDLPKSTASASRAVLYRQPYVHACECGAREVAGEGDCGWPCSHFQQLSRYPPRVSSFVHAVPECWHYNYRSCSCHYHSCRLQTSVGYPISQCAHSTVGSRVEGDPEDRTSLPSRSVPVTVESETGALSPLPLPSLPVPPFPSASPSPSQVSGPLRGSTRSDRAIAGASARGTNAESKVTHTSAGATSTPNLTSPSSIPTPTPNTCLQSIDATISDLENISRTRPPVRLRAYSHPHPPSHTCFLPPPHRDDDDGAPPSSHRRTLSHQLQKSKLKPTLTLSLSSSSTATSYGTLTSLTSLGIGLAEAEREERKAKGLFRKRTGSLSKGQVQGQREAENGKERDKRKTMFVAMSWASRAGRGVLMRGVVVLETETSMVLVLLGPTKPEWT
ncbi:hypothetical protein F5I97DRAFT_263527 [Phlebopus sp. FC_14]|nr:hypothetical protein F5I97DRAFT_263527 [Phlebopus sp. FC_14]